MIFLSPHSDSGLMQGGSVTERTSVSVTLVRVSSLGSVTGCVGPGPGEAGGRERERVRERERGGDGGFI